MSKQPRLRKPVLQNADALASDAGVSFDFESLDTYETDQGVAWLANILDARSGDVVCLVYNNGLGEDNVYRAEDEDLFSELLAQAVKRYPLSKTNALDGFVADLWLKTFERIVDEREAVAAVGF